MKLCAYAMTVDAGFTPNPFWRVCTLAACTPNHQRCNLEAGDWILGNGTADCGGPLIYAMRVDERLTLDDYYHDPRLARKRPGHRTWRQRCGDNIYYRGERGRHAQDPNAVCHTDPEPRSQDVHGDRVFVGTHYFYFGEAAVAVPPRFDALVRRGRGVQYHGGPVVINFVSWLEREYTPGVHGLPRDRERGAAECPAGHAPPCGEEE